MSLYLVRHSNSQVDPMVAPNQWQLSAVGIERAHQLATHLINAGIQIIISSTEVKAIQTAHILAKQMGLQVKVVDRLHEHERPLKRDSLGIDEFYTQVKEFFNHPEQLVFGAETANQVFERFDRALRDIATQHQNLPLAVVSHGTALSLLLSRYNKLDGFSFWKNLDMPEYIKVNAVDFKIIETWAPPSSNIKSNDNPK